MNSPPDHGAQDNAFEIDFDTPARKGWSHFAKFLAGNVVAVAAGLIFIAALTVWR